MKKRVIARVAIIVAILIAMFFLINIITPKTYSTAKKECERFLNNNYEKMEEIAVGLLREGKRETGYYKERYFSYRPDEDLVEFQIDCQGMLGGQYWSLVYTKAGLYFGESEKYLYEETGGNNIIKAEKLDEHWWFLWIDYDGTDGSNK